MSAPKVSIVTPTYNHESFIGACIESVIAQSYPDWEMLVVDDGSDDRTVEIVESFKDPRIRIFREKNRGLAGLAETYNVALSNARGELIAILEGDDYWPPRKLDTQIPDFLDSAVVLSWGRALAIGTDGRPFLILPQTLPPWEGRLNVPPGRAAFLMMSRDWQTFTFSGTVLIRAESLRRIGGFRQPAYLDFVDMPTFMLLSLEGQWRYHPEILGYWRRHAESTTRSRYPRMLNGAYRWCAEFAESYGERIPASASDRYSVDYHWSLFQKDRLLMTGRLLASQGDYSEAASYFEKALEFRIGRRTRWMIGLAKLLLRLRMSPESAFKLGHQPDWRGSVVGKALDPIVSVDVKPEEYVCYDMMKTLPKDEGGAMT